MFDELIDAENADDPAAVERAFDVVDCVLRRTMDELDRISRDRRQQVTRRRRQLLDNLPSGPIPDDADDDDEDDGPAAAKFGAYRRSRSEQSEALLALAGVVVDEDDRSWRWGEHHQSSPVLRVIGRDSFDGVSLGAGAGVIVSAAADGLVLPVRPAGRDDGRTQQNNNNDADDLAPVTAGMRRGSSIKYSYECDDDEGRDVTSSASPPTSSSVAAADENRCSLARSTPGPAVGLLDFTNIVSSRVTKSDGMSRRDLCQQDRQVLMVLPAEMRAAAEEVIENSDALLFRPDLSLVHTGHHASGDPAAAAAAAGQHYPASITISRRPLMMMAASNRRSSSSASSSYLLLLQDKQDGTNEVALSSSSSSSSDSTTGSARRVMPAGAMAADVGAVSEESAGCRGLSSVDVPNQLPVDAGDASSSAALIVASSARTHCRSDADVETPSVVIDGDNSTVPSSEPMSCSSSSSSAIMVLGAYCRGSPTEHIAEARWELVPNFGQPLSSTLSSKRVAAPSYLTSVQSLLVLPAVERAHDVCDKAVGVGIEPASEALLGEESAATAAEMTRVAVAEQQQNQLPPAVASSPAKPRPAVVLVEFLKKVEESIKQHQNQLQQASYASGDDGGLSNEQQAPAKMKEIDTIGTQTTPSLSPRGSVCHGADDWHLAPASACYPADDDVVTLMPSSITAADEGRGDDVCCSVSAMVMTASRHQARADDSLSRRSSSPCVSSPSPLPCCHASSSAAPTSSSSSSVSSPSSSLSPSPPPPNRRSSSPSPSPAPAATSTAAYHTSCWSSSVLTSAAEWEESRAKDDSAMSTMASSASAKSIVAAAAAAAAAATAESGIGTTSPKNRRHPRRRIQSRSKSDPRRWGCDLRGKRIRTRSLDGPMTELPMTKYWWSSSSSSSSSAAAAGAAAAAADAQTAGTTSSISISIRSSNDAASAMNDAFFDQLADYSSTTTASSANDESKMTVRQHNHRKPPSNNRRTTISGKSAFRRVPQQHTRPRESSESTLVNDTDESAAADAVSVTNSYNNSNNDSRSSSVGADEPSTSSGGPPARGITSSASGAGARPKVRRLILRKLGDLASSSSTSTLSIDDRGQQYHINGAPLSLAERLERLRKWSHPVAKPHQAVSKLGRKSSSAPLLLLNKTQITPNTSEHAGANFFTYRKMSPQAESCIFMLHYAVRRAHDTTYPSVENSPAHHRSMFGGICQDK